MPLKDLDKLTVVKLRAELIARGLDSKGNKPFLVERLRFALDQEEKHGVPRPAIKMFTSENELGDASMDQEPEMDDEGLDDGEADENEDVSSNPNQVGNSLNGTTEVSDDPLNNGTHTSCTDKSSITEESLPQVATEPTLVEMSKQISSETPLLAEAAVTEDNAEEADNSTNSALNDSVMAVYGGKNETFMENSTLEQSVDMTVDQTNDNVTNNLTSNSSNLDLKDTSSTPKDTTEASSVDSEDASTNIMQTDASAQNETSVIVSEAKEQQKVSDATPQAEVTDTVVKPEEPVVKPEEPVVKPEEPVVKPEEPVVKPEEPVVKPEEPVVNPEEPVVKPEEPVVKPEEPVVKPEEPVVKPEEPVVKPEEPVVKPEEPVVKPEEPVVKPEEPVFKPEEPFADEKDADTVLPKVEAKEEEKMEVSTAVESKISEESGSPSKEASADDKTDRGSKRQRDRSSSPANVNKLAEGPPPEDEPEWDGSLVVLDWYNSDLNLTISKTDFVSGTPLTEAGFAYMWAGARATYGFLTGKICYEVKVVENLAVSHLEESEPNHHVVRVGWSVDSTTYQLGEDPFSYGYGGTAKISQNCEFKDYGVPFQTNDVVGVYLNASEEKETVEISFSVNGEAQGVAFTLTKEELNGRALFPHIVTKNCRFEVNFGQKEEPWFPPMEGYELAGKIPVEARIRGALTPATRADCQMIMMCGLPGAGKTTWANKYSAENPDRKFNILGTNAFLDKMKVNGLPRRKNYSGRWEVLIEKCTRCLNILLEIAAKRRRNYILDQTNVYPTAQKRKMSYFSGFKRRAVVIVPTEEDAKVRVEKRIQDEGKDVPDSAVMEMKANFKIPSVDDTFSEVEFPELTLEEALKVIEKYSAEAKAAGYGQPSPKRQRQNQGNRNKNDRNDRRSNHSGRDRNRDSRGSNSHRSSSSRSYRDSRDDRHRPPPPSHWRGGGGGGGGPGRGGGWSNRGPPPPLARNGPYSPRRGPPLPPLPPVNRGGWNAPIPERPYPGARSGGGGGGGGGGARGYDDRRNDRPSYSAPRREGPSPWMNSPSMAGAAPQRSSWGHSHSGWNSNSGGGNSSSSSYGQPQQSSYASSAYGGSALYGSAGASRATPSGGYGTPSGITARPTSGNYGSSSATARPVSTPYGGAGITGLARPASYGSNGQARPTSYGPPSLPGSRPTSYGSGSGSARPTSSYSSASINQWSQQQQQQPQQTGYQYPYNPNHSTYSGGK